MHEDLVQWVLLRRPEYLQEKLGFRLDRKIGENYTTEQGRIDFAFETKNEVLVIELETGINNKAKFDYCTGQVKRYKEISFSTEKPVKFIILYDEENSQRRFVHELRDFCERLDIILRTYSILDVQELYKQCLEELTKTAGIDLGQPVAMDVVYLRWLNRFIEPFYRAEISALPREDIRSIFTSDTSFGVYKKLAENFQIVREDREKGLMELTDYGQCFADAYNAEIIQSAAAMPDLSTEQKRVLLEVLTNGTFTKSKVNIYYFLRFLHLTNGEWLPNTGTPEDEEKLQFANSLMGKSYKWTTMRKLLRFTCNQCEELDLAERIRLSTRYDRVVLTSLGSRVLGYLELYLHLKREQIQIPLQI